MADVSLIRDKPWKPFLTKPLDMYIIRTVRCPVMEPKDLPPGERLKRLRENLGLSLRDVEERSEQMAIDKDIQDLSLSRNCLAMIENGGHVPSIFKLYALSAIYCCSWAYLNSLFHLRMSDLAKDQLLYGVPRTRLLSEQTEDAPETVVLPLHF